MIRITKLADYGIVLMAHVATSSEDELHNARTLSDITQIPQPMVSKILKTLARKGFLLSHRGQKGGYSLARPASEMTVADIITALEGPIALIECADHQLDHQCDLESVCTVSDPWKRINDAVRKALEEITLEEMNQGCCSGHSMENREEEILVPKVLN